ncbi:hypothetical protein [uncultured Flavobacterium sp.]|uniref:hypothetical protein n=1 Tax=uncultured Flavobacterium sp. TaxID=165435 RepID=UPI0025EF5A50|nr:hypothetical protein [uncultured Flavobacterium sp.]
MKKIAFLHFTILAISCGSNPNSNTLSSPNDILFKAENNCPDNGDCKFEILQNKGLEIQTDGIGKIYYKLNESTNKDVYRYNYSEKTKDTLLQDAGYNEEIIFEIEKGKKEFSYVNQELQSTKMLFGVFCYCKGKAGYYDVKEGTLKKVKNQLSITIPAIVNNQKTKQIQIKL